MQEHTNIKIVTQVRYTVNINGTNHDYRPFVQTSKLVLKCATTSYQNTCPCSQNYISRLLWVCSFSWKSTGKVYDHLCKRKHVTSTDDTVGAVRQ